MGRISVRYSEDWTGMGDLVQYLGARGLAVEPYSGLIPGEDVCHGLRQLIAQRMSPVLFEKSRTLGLSMRYRVS